MDHTHSGIKFNPQGAGNPGGDANTGDWSGYFLGGTAKGIVSWQNLAAAVGALGYELHSALDADVSALGYIKSAALPDPAPQDGPQGSCRILATDTAGLYGMGFGNKELSAANSVFPVNFFGLEKATIDPAQAMGPSTWVVTNGVAIPSTTVIEVGFYPLSTSGSSGNIVYTLTETDKVVNAYSSGIAANTQAGFPFTDRNADFRAMGSAETNYALGVKLSAGLPAGAAIDVRLSLRTAAY